MHDRLLQNNIQNEMIPMRGHAHLCDFPILEEFPQSPLSHQVGMGLEVEHVAPSLQPEEYHRDFRSRRKLHRHREILLLLPSLAHGVDKFSRFLHACDMNDFGNVSEMVEHFLIMILGDFGFNIDHISCSTLSFLLQLQYLSFSTD